MLHSYMFQDWGVSRTGPMHFYWPMLLIPTVVFYYFSLSLLSVRRLVLWGWGLRTDRVYVYHSLSALHCRPLLIIIIIIIIFYYLQLKYILFSNYCTSCSATCNGKSLDHLLPSFLLLLISQCFQINFFI